MQNHKIFQGAMKIW